jgi:hypothetical protein
LARLFKSIFSGNPGDRIFSNMKNNAIQTLGAVIAFAGVAMFVVVVVGLHLLQPGYDPQHQLMSELVHGRHGWTMFLAFLAIAAALFGIQIGISNCGAARWYQFLLDAAALFFLAAGIFPLGKTTLIHIGAIAIAFVLSAFVMYFFPTNAGRASSAGPRTVSWSLAAGFAAAIALSQLSVPIGISQRLAAACLLAWLSIVAWKLLRLKLK